MSDWIMNFIISIGVIIGVIWILDKGFLKFITSVIYKSYKSIKPEPITQSCIEIQNKLSEQLVEDLRDILTICIKANLDQCYPHDIHKELDIVILNFLSPVKDYEVIIKLTKTHRANRIRKYFKDAKKYMCIRI